MNIYFITLSNHSFFSIHADSFEVCGISVYFRFNNKIHVDIFKDDIRKIEGMNDEGDLYTLWEQERKKE